MKRMARTGVIHGRFQILHNDHLKYLLAGKARCDDMVVGITNPDPTLTRDDPADPQRSLPTSNPLTYYERYLLLQAALTEAGVHGPEFSVVPFPINLPELYRYYVPLDAIFFLTIYDEWGERKLRQFETLGLKTEVLWKKSPGEKGLSGALIRKKMGAGEPWEHLVPKSAARLMKGWDIPARLRNIDRSVI
jgi:nicotinamide mononucleotide adenylyltransferase